MSQSFTLFTKTYRGDFANFAKLCHSIDRNMPTARHIVAVDPADFNLFRQFIRPGRDLIDGNDHLLQLHEFSFLGRRFWWHKSGRIVRGWIQQQLAKLAIVASLEVSAVVILDSDACLLGPLDEADVFDGERVRLFHKPGASSGPSKQSPKWHDAAAFALGLPMQGYTGADYISGAVIWSPQVVRAMLRHIELQHNGDWLEPLLRPMRISEYVIYGVFCEHVAGPHRALVSPTLTELAHCSWNYDFGYDGEIERFVSELPGEAAALLVQSNLNMPAGEREAIISRIVDAHRKLGPDAA